MGKFTITRCPVCEEEVIQGYVPKQVICDVCGKETTTNYYCPNGHHFCNNCRFDNIFEHIKGICLNSKSRNPLEIAEEIMDRKEMSLIGCKHYLIAALAVFTAYKNSGGKIDDFEKSMDVINKRVSKVQMSMCKLGGLCGIPLAIAGAFQSVRAEKDSIENATEAANNISGNCIVKLMNPNNEGSRNCCIRNSAICIVEAAKYIRNNLWIDMELPSVLKCKYGEENPRCNKEKCPLYYGKRTEKF